jgi:hypothetical protein
MNQSVSLEQLQRRVLLLQRTVVFLIACCVALVGFLWLFKSNGKVRASASDSLTVKRLAVVDDKGKERIVIAAPLPDPIIHGQRFKRNGAISGIVIYDSDGNERGGYATSDAGSGALLSLDSGDGEVFKVFANAEQKEGGTLFLFNGKHDGVVLTTHGQPTIEMVQNRKIIFKNPSDAPDVRD